MNVPTERSERRRQGGQDAQGLPNAAVGPGPEGESQSQTEEGAARGHARGFRDHPFGIGIQSRPFKRIYGASSEVRPTEETEERERAWSRPGGLASLTKHICDEGKTPGCREKHQKEGAEVGLWDPVLKSWPQQPCDAIGSPRPSVRVCAGVVTAT